MAVTEFAQKRVLVTGGSGAIGMAVAERLAREGANVVIHASHYQSLQAVQEQPLHDHIVHGVYGDLRQAETCHRVVNEAINALGGLDVLINNAGRYEQVTLSDMTEDGWDSMMDANAKSVVFCTQAALPELVKSRGNVVNVASVSALYAGAREMAFAAAKSAVITLTRSMAAELAPNVRVNVVSPDVVDTPSAQRFVERVDDPERYRKARDERIPMQRIASVSDIVDAICYLASPSASYVTGVNLPVDGGRVAVGRGMG